MFYPMLLCATAGLSTALGGALVTLKGGISKDTMAFSQGFAAGVMLTVSLGDLLPHSFKSYYQYMPATTALKATLSLAFMGWIVGALLTKLVVPEKKQDEDTTILTAKRLAIITTAVMVLHNLPEGVLTMFTSSNDIKMGARMAFAIAMHNLPEGMAIASPVLYVTKNRGKAFFQAFWAGMAEPVGGVIAFLFLHEYINSAFINGLMPIIGGIMCQASICELIPSSVKISNVKHTIYGIIVGAIIMSLGIFFI